MSLLAQSTCFFQGSCKSGIIKWLPILGEMKQYKAMVNLGFPANNKRIVWFGVSKYPRCKFNCFVFCWSRVDASFFEVPQSLSSKQLSWKTQRVIIGYPSLWIIPNDLDDFYGFYHGKSPLIKPPPFGEYLDGTFSNHLNEIQAEGVGKKISPNPNVGEAGKERWSCWNRVTELLTHLPDLQHWLSSEVWLQFLFWTSHQGLQKGAFYRFDCAANIWRNWTKYCWWFRNPKQPPGMYISPCNDGINYLLNGAGFFPSTASPLHSNHITKHFFLSLSFPRFFFQMHPIWFFFPLWHL